MRGKRGGRALTIADRCGIGCGCPRAASVSVKSDGMPSFRVNETSSLASTAPLAATNKTVTLQAQRARERKREQLRSCWSPTW
jgi:hypothetical protein